MTVWRYFVFGFSCSIGVVVALENISEKGGRLQWKMIASEIKKRFIQNYRFSARKLDLSVKYYPWYRFSRQISISHRTKPDPPHFITFSTFLMVYLWKSTRKATIVVFLSIDWFIETIPCIITSQITLIWNPCINIILGFLIPQKAIKVSFCVWIYHFKNCIHVDFVVRNDRKGGNLNGKGLGRDLFVEVFLVCSTGSQI